MNLYYSFSCILVFSPLARPQLSHNFWGRENEEWACLNCHPTIFQQPPIVNSREEKLPHTVSVSVCHRIKLIWQWTAAKESSTKKKRRRTTHRNYYILSLVEQKEWLPLSHLPPTHTHQNRQTHLAKIACGFSLIWLSWVILSDNDKIWMRFSARSGPRLQQNLNYFSYFATIEHRHRKLFTNSSITLGKFSVLFAQSFYSNQVSNGNFALRMKFRSFTSTHFFTSWKRVFFLLLFLEGIKQILYKVFQI